MDTINEREKLIIAAQAGDAKAISHLVVDCQADARRYARKHCKITDIDDAVQESLLVISRKISTLKVVMAFSSWLFVIIKRECTRLERIMSKHEPLEDEVAEQLLIFRSDDDLKIDLIRALESLPPHYLEVVLLRDFEEQSILEIAERLKEDPGAVKSRLHRARELVRKSLISHKVVTD